MTIEELGRGLEHRPARGLKPYPAYKDSGVEWLGEAPTHWEVRRLKTWLDVNELVLSEDTDPEYTFDYVDIGSVATGRLAATPERIRFGNSPSRARRVVRLGDTLVSTVRTYLKAVWHAEQPRADLIASTGFAVLTPRRRTSPKFVSYFCQSDPFTNRVTAESVGIAYPAVAETRLGAFEVCVPPFLEQEAIVRFLDHADRRIRRYTRAKEKLIGLLEEQKRAVIHEAVTGRIDVRTGQPYVAYKDSEVEWLGKVPTHWEVLHLGRLVTLTVGFPFKSDGFTNSDDDTRLLRGVNIAPGRIRWDNVVRWPASDADLISEYGLQTGDIVLGMDRPIVGDGIRVALMGQSDVPALLLQRVARLRPSRKLLRDFAFQLLSGRGFSDYLAPVFTGISVPHVSPEQIKGFRVALPGVAEQQRIVDYLHSRGRTLRSVTERTQDEIALLCEYRARMSGAWAFSGTRVPVYVLFENLAGGATIDEFVDWFPGVAKQQARAMLEHEAKALRKALAR